MAIENIQPDIYILGLRVQEPITALTDLFVTAASFYGYYRINKAGYDDNVRRYLKYYFILMGIAAISQLIKAIAGYRGVLPDHLVSLTIGSEH